MGWVSALAQSALDFLVDERCHACDAPLADAAPPGAAPALAAPVDVITVLGLGLETRLLCTACAAAVRPWPEPVRLFPPGGGDTEALLLFPAFVADTTLLTLIHLLKFGRHERIAPWLAQAMSAGLPSRAPAPAGRDWIVVPVPMDRGARMRRGFNQAESIARALAARWRLPMAPEAIAKVRATRPQSSLGREERLRNLAGAFRARSPGLNGARVILVDDLVTTGATARACAYALRGAGARAVRVVCAGYRDDAGTGRGPSAGASAG